MHVHPQEYSVASAPAPHSPSWWLWLLLLLLLLPPLIVSFGIQAWLWALLSLVTNVLLFWSATTVIVSPVATNCEPFHRSFCYGGLNGGAPQTFTAQDIRAAMPTASPIRGVHGIRQLPQTQNSCYVSKPTLPASLHFFVIVSFLLTD